MEGEREQPVHAKRSGAVQFFPSLDEAKQKAQEVGGIVQVEGAPLLGGFDRALS